jgi:hypothetical protein
MNIERCFVLFAGQKLDNRRRTLAPLAIFWLLPPYFGWTAGEGFVQTRPLFPSFRPESIVSSVLSMALRHTGGGGRWRASPTE